ncbi:MAG: polyphenol oxidase family protein [Candidatus Peribacteraceae bacterium]|nr:polyphenol oxidase family protein [Candidatus Peribacteraceae bacterium]
MITTPFALLRQFEQDLSVALYVKADDVGSDQAAARGIDAAQAAGLWQIHGNKTVIIRGPSNRTEQADGMITNVPGIALCIRAADCQNFVVYEPSKKVLGALHVGWKGLIAGAVPEFFTTLKKEFGIEPSETFVGAGPSLCTTCADFSDPVRELPGLSTEFIHGKTADLQGAATAQMIALGVAPDRIERHPDCTRCHPETYWTYRGGDRERVKEGHTNMLVCYLK